MAGYSDYIISMAAKVISNAVPINDFNYVINRFVNDNLDDFKTSRFHIYDSSSSNIISESSNVGTSNSQSSEMAFEIEVQKSIKNTLSYLKSENYVEGEVTKTQIYLEALAERNRLLFLEVFQRVWVSVYYSPEHLRNYLCIAASMDYELMKDRADVLILGCSGHEDVLVQEAAIRAFESWGNPAHVLHLSAMRKFEETWIENYKQSTIRFLESLR
ncbi:MULTISPECIES: hypothetical protein [Citrobacter]|uniref:hypothetical protein n=1 Tax=Citrobacter TaxID=544 RepID=UPI001904A42A|nr:MULTISPECIES: hypothetical protein [Citrobacter]MBJ9353290.1 hypothetical protein [Citrobacter koseri]MDM2966087.1 hypothetical protein [Citrobacter sp. CK201]MEC5640943.1 hypothetical protein [Citrobacter koseri]WOJ03644.1 hypothetical protein R1157_03535 [Citrobacter koseri]HBL7006721.1 hypothetical protein [Citrobacter koseri]